MNKFFMLLIFTLFCSYCSETEEEFAIEDTDFLIMQQLVWTD